MIRMMITMMMIIIIIIIIITIIIISTYIKFMLEGVGAVSESVNVVRQG